VKQTNQRVDFGKRELTFFRYALPMRDGSVREGALVCTEEMGWGEAAPLPGWSIETLDEVCLFLRNGTGEAPASVRCALEAADAAAWPLHHERVPANALLRGSEEEMLAQARCALANGCDCLKIKTETIKAGMLREFLRSILRDAPGGCRLRLDPNRAWGFDETLRVAESLADLPISYIEEPLREPGRLPELISKCSVPIALDETLRDIRPRDMEIYKGVAALVLKPTLMGGFAVCRQFAEAGSALGMLPVVSSCYESGVGIYALGRFSAVGHPRGLGYIFLATGRCALRALGFKPFCF